MQNCSTTFLYRKFLLTGVMFKALDCGILAREFKLHSRNYVHFRPNTLGKWYKPPYHPIYALNSTTTVHNSRTTKNIDHMKDRTNVSEVLTEPSSILYDRISLSGRGTKRQTFVPQGYRSNLSNMRE